MSYNNNKELTEQLEEIIEAGLVDVAIPFEKGNSIRIKHMIIRKHHNGYRLFNLTTNKHVCTTFTKTAALAIAKMTVEKTNFDLKAVIKLDDTVSKYYMDAVYAKRGMKTSDSPHHETQFDIAYDKAWTALSDIERYIFDK